MGHLSTTLHSKIQFWNAGDAFVAGTGKGAKKKDATKEKAANRVAPTKGRTASYQDGGGQGPARSGGAAPASVGTRVRKRMKQASTSREEYPRLACSCTSYHLGRWRQSTSPHDSVLGLHGENGGTGLLPKSREAELYYSAASATRSSTRTGCGHDKSVGHAHSKAKAAVEVAGKWITVAQKVKRPLSKRAGRATLANQADAERLSR